MKLPAIAYVTTVPIISKNEDPIVLQVVVNSLGI